MEQFSVDTGKRTQFLPITSEVQDLIKKSGVQEGTCLIFIPHTTAGVTINEGADPDVVRDMAMQLDKMVPWNAGYSHGEGNSAAHIKSSLMGSAQQVIIHQGRIALGTWQQIYFCEFDGPRHRKVWVTITPKS